MGPRIRLLPAPATGAGWFNVAWTRGFDQYDRIVSLRLKQHWLPVLAACVTLLPAGCSTRHYRASADREAAAIIADKTPGVRNMDPHFTIETSNTLSLESLRVTTNTIGFLGADGALEVGARILSLEDSLDFAVKFSRNYQSRKEQVYLAALTLTLARHEFTPLFAGRAQAAYRVNTEEVVVVVDALTGQPRVLAAQDALLVEQSSVSARTQLGASWLLRTGARISAAATTDFLRYLSGDPRAFTGSQLGVALLQPLWRGSGYKVTMENLTQSERNMLYALRDFTRYRKDFSVQIATAYYGVLQNRDAVRNNWLGYQSFKRSAERSRAFVQEGRTKLGELGRLEQQELTSEAAWINAVRNYKQSLDSFKILIGLATDANVVLDTSDLEKLKILHPKINVEEAIQVALVMRLDYQTARDTHEDTSRRIPVAADALKAQVDLVASAGINSGPALGRGVELPDPNRYHWDAGLNLDLPLERTAQRNAYRSALIADKQSERDQTSLGDTIRLQVRDGWRSLEQARRNYEISELTVRLSERRVEEEDLLAELGRGVAKDQVDAQNDLINSKNQRTQALVAHTIARVQFWNNLGILYIKENGQWEEIPGAKE